MSNLISKLMSFSLIYIILALSLAEQSMATQPAPKPATAKYEIRFDLFAIISF